jgi:hypothetical protein
MPLHMAIIEWLCGDANVRTQLGGDRLLYRDASGISTCSADAGEPTIGRSKRWLPVSPIVGFDNSSGNAFSRTISSARSGRQTRNRNQCHIFRPARSRYGSALAG